MKIRFWGVRGSTPTPGLENLRYGGNTPCVEIRTAAGEIYILDCGTGFRLLGQHLAREFGHRRIEAQVFLSHYHWDHIQGIPFFEPLYNPENTFHFHSFKSDAGSVEDVVEGQMSDPYFPVKMDMMQSRRDFHDTGDAPLEFDGIRVRSLPLNHPQGCLGFRIECEGFVVVYATDNEPGSPEHDRNVRTLSEGADILIYDAQYTPLEYSNNKRGWGHSTWREGVNMAQQCGVRQLVLFHHDPDHDDVFVDSIIGEARKYFANSVAAWESLEIDLSKQQHLQPQEQVERRLGKRQRLLVPVRVQGTRTDGTTFQEVTYLENLSVAGGYFFLENDPDANEPLVVELQIPPEETGNDPSGPIQSRVVRNQSIITGDKKKFGIGVSF